MTGRSLCTTSGRAKAALVLAGGLAPAVLAPMLVLTPLATAAQASPLPDPDPIAGLTNLLPTPSDPVPSPPVPDPVPSLPVPVPTLTEPVPTLTDPVPTLPSAGDPTPTLPDPTASASDSAAPAGSPSPTPSASSGGSSTELPMVGPSLNSALPSTNPTAGASAAAATPPVTVPGAPSGSTTAVSAGGVKPQVDALTQIRSAAAARKHTAPASPLTPGTAVLSATEPVTLPVFATPAMAQVSNALLDPQLVPVNVSLGSGATAPAAAKAGPPAPAKAPATMVARASADVHMVAADPAALGVGITAIAITAAGLAVVGQIVVRARRA